MKKVLLSTIASFLFVTALQSNASAITQVNGYVCSTEYSAQRNSLLGMDGFVSTRIYTQPYCQGSFVDEVYHQSNDGSYGGYEFSEAERIGLFQVMKNAAENGLRVLIYIMDDGGVLHTRVYSY
jgi:hypothetical protein